MKFNMKEKILNLMRNASLTSRILFVLCVVSGIAWILTRYSGFTLIVTGLFGVLWLSSIALHSFRRGKRPGRNPFTLLIALCAAVSIGCLLVKWIWQPQYHESMEPINTNTEFYRHLLNDLSVEEIKAHGDTLFSFSSTMDGTDANLIVLDENNRVISRENQWTVGKSETVRTLICPADRGNGDALMVLIDGKGNVLGVFWLENGYSGDAAADGSSYSPLTIRDSEDAAEPDVSENETALTTRDPLYEKYFPSFGTAIDRAAFELVSANLKVGEGLYQSYEEKTIFSWNGENVIEVDGNSDASLLRELNNLTAAEREKLKEYLTWLSQALEAVRNRAGNYNSFHARILTRDDGQLTAIMLYEYNQEDMYPLRDRYMMQLELENDLDNANILMIPAAIVFLAFWVFVDAKKRGQSAPALWAVLTLIGNIVTWIIYMLIRPQMTTGVTGMQMPKGSCPICGTKLRSDFIACPGCGILIRSRCRNCGRALENDWSFCPYCTQAVIRELPGEAKDSAPAESGVSSEKA